MNKTEYITIRVTKDTIKKLDRLARKQKVRRSDIIRDALDVCINSK